MMVGGEKKIRRPHEEGRHEHECGNFIIDRKFAKCLDVVNPAQARIAEEAGACAVMALERVPAQIRKDGGVARASDPEMIIGIQKTVSIPVMAKCRIGHFVENGKRDHLFHKKGG